MNPIEEVTVTTEIHASTGDDQCGRSRPFGHGGTVTAVRELAGFP
jgi:hypothetical protein